MASLRPRPETGLLFFDFRWEGKRYRAQTDLPDNDENRHVLAPKLRKLNEAIKRGQFRLEAFFPELVAPAPKPTVPAPLPPASAAEAAAPVAMALAPIAAAARPTPTFSEFSAVWFAEFKVGWRRTYITTVRGILDQHLLPRFGALPLGAVKRAEIMDFRACLAQLRGRRPGTTLSPARINTVMLILRQILQEAADRYEFTMPMGKLKPLKIPKSQVAPFSLEEAHLLIDSVRKDYQNYMKVRIFTGMRSGELHGLKWKYVDFVRRLILVREAIVAGEEDETKTESSIRDIQMSQVVFDALRGQHKATGTMTYVFCNRAGEPIDTMNFTKRVWYPLLRHLNLEPRRPYQTRHTAATLWLASGESPQWIANQLGHSNSQMLFTVYGRFVPNMTRQDGSAMERLLATRFAKGDAAAAGTATAAANEPGNGKGARNSASGDDTGHAAQPPPVRRAA